MKKILLSFIAMFLLMFCSHAQNINLVNVGTNANDHTGDPLRVAFQKINTNFLNVQYSMNNIGTATNINNASGTNVSLTNPNIYGNLNFNGTNTPPVSTNLVVWISVQIAGDTNRYRLGLAK